MKFAVINPNRYPSGKTSVMKFQELKTILETNRNLIDDEKIYFKRLGKPSDKESHKKSGEKKSTTIAVGVVISLIILALIVIVVYWYSKKRYIFHV